MKHDELLAKIESFNKITTEGMERKALRAIVELHKPDSKHSDGTFCNECVIDYPCPTIQAIEKKLQ
jgi:uncharacterized protein (UPF0335 family)